MTGIRYLVLLGAFVNVLGSLGYIRETIRGNAKPNRVTWLLWSIAPFIAAAAALVDGVTWAVLPVFMAGFCPFLVFLASFVNKKSYWKLEKFDYLCGLFSLLALLMWAITKQAFVAIIFAILSDFSAAVPTLIKSWKYPESETWWAYSSGLFNALTSFAAITTWAFVSMAFPTYLAVLCSSLLLIIYRKKLF
jgi:hypothetical protein